MSSKRGAKSKRHKQKKLRKPLSTKSRDSSRATLEVPSAEEASTSTNTLPIPKTAQPSHREAFNVSVELRRLLGSHRHQLFVDYVTRKYCPENFLCWVATDDLITDVRNDTLESLETRNEKFFKIMEEFVNLDGAHSVTINLALQQRLETLAENIKADPTAFDTRPILVLQKEAEVLLVRDLKAFCAQCPYDELAERKARERMEAFSSVMVVEEEGHQKLKLPKNGVVSPRGGAKEGGSGSGGGLSLWTSRNQRHRREPTRFLVKFCDKKVTIWTTAEDGSGEDDDLIYTIPGQLADVHSGDIPAIPDLDSNSFSMQFVEGEDSAQRTVLFFRPDTQEQLQMWLSALKPLRLEYIKTQKGFQAKRDQILSANVGVNRDFMQFVDNQKMSHGTSTPRLQKERKKEQASRAAERAAERQQKERSAYYATSSGGYSASSGYEVTTDTLGGYDVPSAIRLTYGGSPSPFDDHASESVEGDEKEDGDNKKEAAEADRYKRKVVNVSSDSGEEDASHNEGSASVDSTSVGSASVGSASVGSASSSPRSPSGSPVAVGGMGMYMESMAAAAAGMYAGSPLSGGEAGDSGSDNSIDSNSSSSGSSSFVSSEQGEDSTSSSDEGLDDFNEQFQTQVARMHSLSSHEYGEGESRRMAIYAGLIRIAEDFRDSATRYGRIIISEVYLPQHKKTIRPNRDIGGVIGGEKYVVGKILFKFAIDSGNVFGGSDEFAAKVAGLELKGLQAYFNVRDPDLHFPLMALIDYKGFRLIASSLLPLGRGSLAYGSQDAAKTVHKDIPDLTAAVERASAQLNLKMHKCGDSGTVMATCVDIEGHAGKDGRYYMIDFSRVFPPVTPNRTLQGSHLFRMFRPEFVQSFKLFKLCSDGYSNFTIMHEKEAKEHMDEIDLATTDLLSVLVQNFASEVSQLMEQEGQITGSLEHFRLTQLLHSRGINVRYLGLVLKKMGRHRFSVLLLANMCARIVKNDIRYALRSKMKAVRVAIDEPFRDLVVEKLNLVFSNTEASVLYWRNVIQPDLNLRFDLRPENWNYFPKDLRTELFAIENLGHVSFNAKYYIFTVLQRQLGLVLAPELVKLLHTYPLIYSQPQVFDSVDLDDVGLRVKFMDVISNAQGYVFSHRAMEKEKLGLHLLAQSLYQRALQSYEAALNATPNDADLLRSCAIVMVRLHKLQRRIELGLQASDAVDMDPNHALVLRANSYFTKAIQANRQSTESYSVYARFLADLNRNDEAEAHFLESLVKEPNQVETLQQYSTFLRRSRLHHLSKLFAERSQKVKACQDKILKESSMDLSVYLTTDKLFDDNGSDSKGSPTTSPGRKRSVTDSPSKRPPRLMQSARLDPLLGGPSRNLQIPGHPTKNPTILAKQN